MKYRNVKTGAILELCGTLKSATWEPIQEKAPQKEPERKGTKKK